MKKVLLSVTGIALIVLLLAALGGVVLASGEDPAPVDVIEEQVIADLTKVVSEQSAGMKEASSAEETAELAVAEDPPAREQVVEQDILADDDPEDEHPDEEHTEGGCGGYADPSKLAAKIDAAAEFLGMTPEEVAAQVQAGKWLYEIAAEQGADVEAFREAVHAVVNEAGGCGCGSH